MKRVINFSGGLSSAYMTILNYNPDTDTVVFCDTGREHEKTYQFINDFERFENIPIVRLGGENAFFNYLDKRDFEHIPNMQKRSCTLELKIKVARRYARQHIGMKYHNLIGFRFDEEIRVRRHQERWKQVKTLFPLFDSGITKYLVNEYWKSKRYTLEIPNILGNCTLCFMKGSNAIINILRQFPELAQPWIDDEKRSAKKYGHTYLKDLTIQQCLNIASQPDLFTAVNLELIEPANNCSCTL